jgi:2-dehydro-3-deoxy-D-arabinonate dehydratase
MKLYRAGKTWSISGEAGVAPLDAFGLDRWLAERQPVAAIQRLYQSARKLPEERRHDVGLPVEHQEVWAAGVTYLRSKDARMAESQTAASAYDLVYDAPRPEIFLKATARRCAGSGGVLKLRDDSTWMVPEPELTLVVSAHRELVGFTLGNDLSCRDIEGANTLYLPQAKIWDGCCGIGPAILINDGSFDIRACRISIVIARHGSIVFEDSTEIARIKRPFEELIDYLFRNQSFPEGVLLLTGTGIVPPDHFTLQRGDEVSIEVSEIGRLVNRME